MMSFINFYMLDKHKSIYYIRQLFIFGIFCLASLTSALATACTLYPLLTPARFETSSHSKVTLRWSAQLGQAYRLQVLSTLPEWRVLSSIDTEVTGDSFVLQLPASAAHASVKVLISQQCPNLDMQDLQAQTPWFFLDSRASCAVDADSLRRTAAGLAWAAVPGAADYVVRVFEAPHSQAANSHTGGLTLALEIAVPNATTQWAVPIEWAATANKPALRRAVAVQARCASYAGHPAAMVWEPW